MGDSYGSPHTRWSPTTPPTFLPSGTKSQLWLNEWFDIQLTVLKSDILRIQTNPSLEE
jgi:hypothetical protein